MNGLMQDLRYALRTFAKSPGFTAVSVLTLAIGIGANSAIFSFVDAALLKPLPYADANRIVRVLEKPPGYPRNGISTLTYLDWQHDNTVFDYMAAQTGSPVTLTGRGEPVQLRGGRVSAHYFDIFGMKAALGRTFAPDEDQLGRDHVAVLSHVLWETQFGADSKLLGQTIRLDGEPYTVIGVLPAGSAFDRAFNQIWLPLAFKPENMTRNFHWFGSFARLKPRVTLQQARLQMDAIGSRIAREYPDSNKGWGVVVEPVSEVFITPETRQALYILLGAVGMILLIGCGNLANLTLARGAAREREVAVRAALGAARHRLIRQFLTENVLLSIAGGLAGLAVGYATMRAIQAAIPPYTLPREVNVIMDARVLLFTFLLSVLTGLVFGLVPAIGSTRADLTSSLKEGARGAIGGTHGRLRAALVVGEVALAFVLLSGAGLLIRSFFHMLRADPGFDSTNVITAGLPLSDKQYPDPARLNLYLRQILANIEILPGVREAAFASALPMRGWGYGMPFQIADQPVVDRANRQDCFFKMVSSSYFHALGMRLRKGRGLSDRDVAGTPPVTVINETMVRKYFSKQDPVGKRILVQQIIPGKTQLGPEMPWEVVGVVADERVNSLDAKEDSAGMYVTNEQSPVYFGGLVVRAASDPTVLQKALRQAVYAIDKSQPLTEVKTLEQLKSESVASDRVLSVLLAVFGGVALLLAAIGIYGVISYSVAHRTSEMGIRAALGASPASLVGLILRNGVWMTGAGLVLGIGGALGVPRLMKAFLFGAGGLDPLTLASVAGILGGVALLACYVPARRATKIDPVVALRYE
ncbi:MAG TPA: ABC transporter permease [Bryobacteraceae bacterium]|nr:ABC transporter permease [Bryobacteraceae bacterium]